MKFRFISGLLLTVSTVFANSSSCADELSKYNTCISSIDLDSINGESDIETMCSKFKSGDCESFLSDISLTTTSCDIKNNDEKSDALSILNARIAYLKYCATDDSGNTCPVSKHLAEDIGESNESQSHNHNHSHNTSFTEDDIKPRQLSEFNGEYQSVYPYFLTGDLADYVVQQAEKNNNTYAEQKDIINEKWNCGVKYFEVKDNRISFTYEDGRNESAEYSYAGFATKKNDKGEISSTRYKFETDSKDAPKYVMLNDHCHEPSNEEITHVHLHFGNVSFDEIMASKLISFFVQKRYNSDETREVLLGHDGYDETLLPGEEVSTFDDSEVKDRTLSNWNGEWKSVYKNLLDGELDEAFEAKAKSKGDKTASEYKDYYKKGYETDLDSVTIKNNEIIYTFNDGKSVTAKYQYQGYYIQHWSSGTKAAMYRFENVDKKSTAPLLIEINDHLIKRSKPVHFHLRMSNTNWDDVDAENHWPTFFPKSSSIDDIVAEISGVAHSHETEESEEEEQHNHDVDNHDASEHDHEHEHAFYHDLLDDCQILECNKRFITLVELLKVTGNSEASEFEEFIKYYQNKNCDGLQKLIEENSGSFSIKNSFISSIFVLLLSLFLFFIEY